MTDDKYNGWSNYETWLAALHINNDRRSYEYWREIARQTLKTAKDDDAAVGIVAERLAIELREGLPIDLPTLAADLLNAALVEVNCYEIAGAIVEEIAEVSSSANESKEEVK